MPAPSDEARGVRGIDLYVRSDATQLTELSARVDRGELTVDVAERVPMADLADVHARAADGRLHGKIVVAVRAYSPPRRRSGGARRAVRAGGLTSDASGEVHLNLVHAILA